MEAELSKSKPRGKWIAGILSCLLLASCGKEVEESFPHEGMISLDFSARVSPEARPLSRAAVDGDKFPKGEYVIGLWVCKAENTGTPSAFEYALRGYNNLAAELKASESGEDMWNYRFESRNHQTLSVRQGKDIDIYAYYPRIDMEMEGVTFTPDKIPFTSGMQDWMWADSAPAYMKEGRIHLAAAQTGNSPDQPPVTVPLRFHHAMTCIQVGIKCKYSGNIRLSAVTLTDKKGRLYRKGTMNAWTGELGLDAADKGKEITISPNAVLSTVEQNYPIMMPAVEDYEDGDFTLTFTYEGIGGEQEGWVSFPLPNTMDSLTGGGEVTIGAFETGKRYIYHLTLDNTLHFAPVGVDEEWATGETDIDLEL